MWHERNTLVRTRKLAATSLPGPSPTAERSSYFAGRPNASNPASFFL